ncbi:MAG: helix-turn-helix domain-containing protein [Candidatus Solibacter sp.]
MQKAKRQSQDLAAIRRQKGISLTDIADSTKICLRYLQAIECGEFARLPGGIYGTSYIRQYARAVAVPEGELLARYLQLSR